MSRAPTEILQTYRRDQILNAAREVIGENGYEKSSVDQIAKRAGVSRSTVYEYFSSKEDILKGCFAARREVIAEEFARRIDGAPGLEERLAAFFEICLSRVDENREFFLAIAFPLPPDEATASEAPGDIDRTARPLIE
jgi:AcrR family transcriptional regulator